MTAPVQRLLSAVPVVAFVSLYIWHGGKAALFLSIMALLILISGLFIHVFGPRRIHIRRQMRSDRIMAGERVRVHVELEFDCRIPLLWIVLCENTPAGVHRKLFFPGTRRQFAYDYQLSGLRRGLYHWGTGRLYWGDVFGWNTVSAETVLDTTLIVVPPGSASGESDAAEFAASAEGAIAERRSGQGNRSPEFREYQPGDPMGRIDWKSTAKTGKLQTFLPEISESPSLGILVYEGKTGYKQQLNGSKDHPAFERAINMAARWIHTAERDSVPYQLWVKGGNDRAGEQDVWPDDLIYSDHMNLSLDRLAQARIASAASSVSSRIETVMLDRLPTGSRIVVLTGRLDAVLTEWITQAAGLGHRVEVQLTESPAVEESSFIQPSNLAGNNAGGAEKSVGGSRDVASDTGALPEVSWQQSVIWLEQLRLSGVRISSIADGTVPSVGKVEVSDVGA